MPNTFFLYRNSLSVCLASTRDIRRLLSLFLSRAARCDSDARRGIFFPLSFHLRPSRRAHQVLEAARFTERVIIVTRLAFRGLTRTGGRVREEKGRARSRPLLSRSVALIKCKAYVKRAT